MDVTEFAKILLKKQQVKWIIMKLVYLLLQKKRQNYFGGELVAINDTQNVNHVNKYQTNYSIQKFSTSSE